MDMPVRWNSAGHGGKPYQVGAFCNDPVTRLKTFLNLHHAAIANTDFDRTPQKGLACGLYKDHRPPCLIDQGRFRNHWRVIGGCEQEAQEDRLVERQAMIAIVYLIGDGYGARLFIHHSAY